MSDLPELNQRVLSTIGCGNMGGAIFRGLKDNDQLELVCFDLSEEKRAALAADCGGKQADSVREVVEKSDYILLAVKPQHLPHLLHEVAPLLRPDQVLISIAAGISLPQLKDYNSGACPVVRVMPNTPAMVGAGVSALCFEDPDLTDENKQFVRDVFNPIGQTYELPESAFDAFTAIAGSGPAYVLYFMEAMVEAGVNLGLSRDQATGMVEGLFTGTAKMAVESDTHLSLLREMVTSPAGTTIEATQHFDRTAIRGHIVDAIRACCARSKELGSK